MDFSTPCTDWSDEAIAEFGRRMADLAAAAMAASPKGRVAPEATCEQVAALFSGPLPENGKDALALIEEIRANVLPHSANLSHPMYFGLMDPSPLPVAVFADAVISALNQNSATWFSAPAATHIEEQVVRWFCDLFGYGPESFGLVVDGGTVANLLALKAARDAKGPAGLRRSGLADSPQMTLYASEEGHYSIERAADVLGFGAASLRRIPCDGAGRMIPEALARAIDDDKRANLWPLCVVASAGTAHTGAIDPIQALAAVCAARGLWLHVDAAYGGAAMFSPKHRPKFQGIGLADSVAFDPHKRLSIPFTAGILLVRDKQTLRRAFEAGADYLPDGQTHEGKTDFYQFGLQNTRRFDALKIWLALRHIGRAGYARLVEAHVELAQTLASLLRARNDFEVLNSVELGLVCFRYLPQGGGGEEQIDSIQDIIQQRIEHSGKAWLGVATLRGRRALRADVGSYHTRPSHLTELVAWVAEEGARAVNSLS